MPRPVPPELDVSPIDIAYSSLMKIDDRGVRGRRHPRDDLKIKALEFDDNLKPNNYLDWVHAIETIFKLRCIMMKRRSSWLF